MNNLFDTAAQDGAQGGASAGGTQTYAVQVDGQTLELTLEQLVQAAQAGLDTQNQAVRREHAAAATPMGDVYAAFLAEYPNVAPADIPPEVWQDAQTEGSLVAAYRKYELAQLRMQLAALTRDKANRALAIGSAASDGEAPEGDPIVRALLGK